MATSDLTPWVDQDELVGQAWPEIQERFANMRTVQDTFRKSQVSGEQIQDWIAKSTDGPVVQARNEVDRLMKQVAEFRNELRAAALKALKVDDLSEEDVETYRKAFVEDKESVQATINAIRQYARLMKKEELGEAAKALSEEIPSLRGQRGAGGTGKSKAEVAREWLRANRPEVKVSERGRLSVEARAAYTEATGVELD